MIQVENLTKVFGSGASVREALALAGHGATRSQVQRRTGATLAVHDVSFAVEPGELFVIMGLSGSGKSTLVRLLNRLIEPSSGTITINDRVLSDMPPKELRDLRNRHMSMVFQHFALLPHRTVLQNTAYALQIRHVSDNERRDRALWALDQVGLAERADAYPGQLSGGMKQRVGLARALAADTDVLLMDEPFSALDPLIRRDMQALLIRLQQELRKTIIFITHDLNEAMRLGDRILLLKDGRVVQLGTGPEILSAPADEYVADFVSDVDRTRVLTADDLLREPRLVVHLGDHPKQVLDALGRAEANGAYVVDDNRRILGVVRDDALAREVNAGQSQLTQNHLVQEYLTTTSDRPLIDIADLVGKHVVPLAVVDDQRRLLGVVPRAAVLSALAANSKPQPAPATAAPALAKG